MGCNLMLDLFEQLTLAPVQPIPSIPSMEEELMESFEVLAEDQGTSSASWEYRTGFWVTLPEE